MRRYDMWGTDDAGVAEFKASFGGYEQAYIGAWELVTDRLVHGAFAGLARIATRTGRVAGRRRIAGTCVAARHGGVATGRPGGLGRARRGRARWARDAGHRLGGASSLPGCRPAVRDLQRRARALVVLRHQPLAPGIVATCRRGPAHAALTGTELAGHVAVLGDAMRDLGARELFVDPELDADPGYEAAMDALGARRHGRVPALDPRDAPGARRQGATEEGVFGGHPEDDAPAHPRRGTGGHDGAPRRDRRAARRRSGSCWSSGRTRWASRCARSWATSPRGGGCIAAGQARLLRRGARGRPGRGPAAVSAGRHALHRVLRRPGRAAPLAAGHDAPRALDRHP